MNKNENIQRLIEDAINATDGICRATPKPFLLTRINAKLTAVAENPWERVAVFIGKPVFLIPAFCLMLLVNLWVIFDKNAAATNAIIEQGAAMQADDFSNTIATFYDIENP